MCRRIGYPTHTHVSVWKRVQNGDITPCLGGAPRSLIDTIGPNCVATTGNMLGAENSQRKIEDEAKMDANSSISKPSSQTHRQSVFTKRLFTKLFFLCSWQGHPFPEIHREIWCLVFVVDCEGGFYCGNLGAILLKNRERKFSPNFFWLKFKKPPWDHGRPRLRVKDVPTDMFFCLQEFRGPDRSFCPGRSPGYPRGRPRDIRPQNLLFGLLIHSKKTSSPRKMLNKSEKFLQEGH